MTVEAALLMSILLPVLTALFLEIFYLHDSAVMQGACCELAVMGSCLAEEKDQKSQLDKRKNSLITHRFLWTKSSSGTVSVDKKNCSVQLEGKFRLPGLTAALLTQNQAEISKTWKRKILHPAETIWTIRGIAYAARVIKG